MSPDTRAFPHRYIATEGARRTLLLLHGTGGDETSLLELGRMIDSTANLLSPRGRVVEHGMPRFFRRLAEGVFDAADLVRQTHALAEFVAASATAYHFDPSQVMALGYSNGANIAGSMLLLRPESLAAAILLRAMVPLTPTALPDLHGKPILLCSGRMDAIVPPDQPERLAALFQQAGADVTLRWSNNGHDLVPDEIRDAQRWLASLG